MALRNSSFSIRKEVREWIGARRKRAVAAHNQAKNIVTPNLGLGNFVSIRKHSKYLYKVVFSLTGPRTVIEVKSSAVCVMQNHLTKKQWMLPKFASIDWTVTIKLSSILIIWIVWIFLLNEFPPDQLIPFWFVSTYIIFLNFCFQKSCNDDYNDNR